MSVESLSVRFENDDEPKRSDSLATSTSPEIVSVPLFIMVAVRVIASFGAGFSGE